MAGGIDLNTGRRHSPACSCTLSTQRCQHFTRDLRTSPGTELVHRSARLGLPFQVALRLTCHWPLKSHRPGLPRQGPYYDRTLDQLSTEQSHQLGVCA